MLADDDDDDGLGYQNLDNNTQRKKKRWFSYSLLSFQCTVFRWSSAPVYTTHIPDYLSFLDVCFHVFIFDFSERKKNSDTLDGFSIAPAAII